MTVVGDAALMSEAEFLDNFNSSKFKKDDAIVTMCVLGIRARTAQLALIGAGFKNVR